MGELLIRGGTVVDETGARRADVLIDDDLPVVLVANGPVSGAHIL